MNKGTDPMRWRVWLATGTCIAALACATVMAEPRRPDAGKNEATTRPSGRSEPGEKGTEPRRPARGSRGEGRARIPSADIPQDTDRPRAGPGDLPGPDGGPPPGEHPGGPMFGPSQERIDRVMKFLDEHYPRLHERLTELREQDPRAFHRQLSRLLPRMPDLMSILDRNPELGKLIIDEHRLEMDIRDAIREYHRARNDADRDQLKEQIRDLISRQFDVRQEKLKLMIADMERELERKKQVLAEQAARKDKLIDRDLRQRLDPDL